MTFATAVDYLQAHPLHYPFKTTFFERNKVQIRQRIVFGRGTLCKKWRCYIFTKHRVESNDPYPFFR